MDKLISQLPQGVNSLLDTDEVEVQYLGEASTKRLTGARLRAVEKAERQAQDDVIEDSCGLQTDGTYSPESDSWYIRAADFLAGCTDRGGATGALAHTIQNALRLLDAKAHDAGSGSLIILCAGLNADITLTNIIPSGYMLEYCVFNEKAGNAAVLDLGTTVGGNEVLINQPVNASGLTSVGVGGRVFSLSVATTLYLNATAVGSDWNGALIDLYLVLRPISVGGIILGAASSVITIYTTALSMISPPEAEIDALIGGAGSFAPGSTFLIYDTNTVSIYVCISDGTDWFFNSSSYGKLV